MSTSDLNKHFREALRDMEHLPKQSAKGATMIFKRTGMTIPFYCSPMNFKQLVTLSYTKPTFRPNVMSLNSSY